MNCADCLPLKVGDDAYILRQQSGTGLTIRRGTVSEITITHQHRPMFTVHYVGRGYYGETVFKTLEEATAKLEKLRRKEATQDADTQKN